MTRKETISRLRKIIDEKNQDLAKSPDDEDILLDVEALCIGINILDITESELQRIKTAMKKYGRPELRVLRRMVRFQWQHLSRKEKGLIAQTDGHTQYQVMDTFINDCLLMINHLMLNE